MNEGDESGPERPVILLSARWLEATRDVSLEAGGLLALLIRQAATAGRPEIAVSLGNVAAELRSARDRAAFPSMMAELRLKGLVRPVRPGVFAIAAGLWKVGAWDPGDKDFFPLV